MLKRWIKLPKWEDSFVGQENFALCGRLMYLRVHDDCAARFASSGRHRYPCCCCLTQLTLHPLFSSLTSQVVVDDEAFALASNAAAKNATVAGSGVVMVGAWLNDDLVPVDVGRCIPRGESTNMRSRSVSLSLLLLLFVMRWSYFVALGCRDPLFTPSLCSTLLSVMFTLSLNHHHLCCWCAFHGGLPPSGIRRRQRRRRISTSFRCHGWHSSCCSTWELHVLVEIWQWSDWMPLRNRTVVRGPSSSLIHDVDGGDVGRQWARVMPDASWIPLRNYPHPNSGHCEYWIR